MAQSAEVNAGDDVLASQYNNLRKDTLDAALGHKHDGKTDGGAVVGSPLFPKLTDMVGDGSDGDLTLTTLLELSESKQFNNVTLNSGGEIRPAAGVNFLVIHIKGTLTINSGGKIQADGFGAAGGASAGGAGSDGFVTEATLLPETIGGQTNGADGKRSFVQVTARTDAGDDLFFGFGAGGGGSHAGSNPGGKGGDKWSGGGAGDTVAPAFNIFAGGNGGGCLIIFADTVVINAGGEITARGAAGAGTDPTSVGSGGGGGGLVYLASKSLTNAGLISATGGAGATTAAPSQGGDGADGLVVQKTIPG